MSEADHKLQTLPAAPGSTNLVVSQVEAVETEPHYTSCQEETLPETSSHKTVPESESTSTITTVPAPAYARARDTSQPPVYGTGVEQPIHSANQGMVVIDSLHVDCPTRRLTDVEWGLQTQYFRRRERWESAICYTMLGITVIALVGGIGYGLSTKRK